MVKISSLKGQIRLLLMAFAALVTISVVITYWGLEAQKTDAMVINLAGRQRMLLQQMTRLALEVQHQPDADKKLALRESMIAFEQTLTALIDGGPAPYYSGLSAELPAAKNTTIIERLQRVAQSWPAFRFSLDQVLDYTPETPEFQLALQNVETQSPQLIQQMDEAVRQISQVSRQNLNRLKWAQAAFLAAALGLLGLGRWLTQRSLIAPLQEVGEAARRIGQGDLASPVEMQEPEEVRLLSETLENMRLQLRASREALLSMNERLEENVAQRTRELEALYTVSREISSRLDIQHVLRSVADKARQLLGGEAAYLCLLDQKGRYLHLQATSGPPNAVVEIFSTTQAPFVGQVLSSPQAVMCNVAGCHGYCEIMSTPYRASHLAAPLRVGERVIGALCVGSTQTNAFSEDAMDLLTRLASAAAIALENARLYEQAERTATLEERQRLAAEMHDGLAQTLSYLQLTIDLAREQVEKGRPTQAMETLARGQRAIDQAALEIRRAIANLQQELPLRYTLQEQLAELVAEFPDDGAPIECKPEVKEPVVLPRDQAEQALRVAREALLNARRHSQASRILLTLSQEEGCLKLSVEDDGSGFDLDSLPCDDGRPHFGVNIMYARAARLGGDLQIQSAPGAGTRVVLKWPTQFSGELA